MVACGVVVLAVAVTRVGVVVVFDPLVPGAPLAVPPEWFAVPGVCLVGCVLVVGHAVPLRRDLAAAALARACVVLVCVVVVRVVVVRVVMRRLVVSVRLAAVAVV